jgi:hypothetical protein
MKPLLRWSLSCFALLVGLLVPLSGAAFATSATPTPIPLPLCADFGGSTSSVVRAGGGSASGASIFCTVLVENGKFVRNPAELGSQAVIDLGVVQAVDVYGLTNSGIAVPNFTSAVNLCLQGSGTLIYMDALQTPRVPTQMTSSFDGSYTCALVSHAGTVALVSGAVSAPAQSTPAPGETPGTPVPGVITEFTSLCTGQTTAIVRLREEPSTDSKMIARLPYQTTWRVTAKTEGWYRIVYLDGQAWVSARYFRADCAG